MKFSVGSVTDVGMKRSQNQDSLIAEPEIGLFVVADGMGGHQGGEIASQMAVEVISHLVCQAMQNENWDPQSVLNHAIQKASQAIHKKATDTPELSGMGTTTVSLLFKGDSLTVGHVGDSRCYMIRDQHIWQITRDHSLVQEKLRAGMITRDALKTDRMKNVITRSVGFEPILSVDLYRVTVLPGDLYLLCSDGLSGLVEDDAILKIVADGQKNSKPTQAIAKDLVDRANQNGGDDNVSTLLIEVLHT